MSEPHERPAPSRRSLVLAISVCVLVAVVFCAGGIALVTMNDTPERVPSSSSLTLPPLPWIVVGDGQAVENSDLEVRLREETERLAETIEAGEKVYAAARRSAPASDLKRLRVALDAAADALERELDEDADERAREKRIDQLKKLRARVLEAAAEITEVRTVPEAELPSGTTAVAADDGSMPGGDGSHPRGGGATSGGDIDRGSSGGDRGGSGNDGGGSGGGSGPGDDDGDDEDGGEEPTEPTEPTATPSTPPPSSPSPTASPSSSSSYGFSPTPSVR